jgi:ABC-2 type transport system permease protein
MRVLLNLAGKDLKILVRDRFSMFWILAFPVVYALFFGAIFSDSGDGNGRGGIQLAFVDQDGSEASAALIEGLSEHDSIRVERVAGERTVFLRSRDDARELVRKGRRTAYVLIPTGFGENPWALFAGGAGDAPTIEVGVDPLRQAEAGFLQGLLMEVLFSGLANRFQDKPMLQADIASARKDIAAADDLDLTQKLLLQTFMVSLSSFVAGLDMDLDSDASDDGGGAGEGDSFGSDGGSSDGGVGLLGGAGLGGLVDFVDVRRDRSGSPRSSYEVTFPQSMVWGLMSVAMTFAIMIVRERKAGTLLRLRIAPIAPWKLLAGKALSCFLACLGVMAFLFGLGKLALGVRFESPALMLVGMLCTAACFTGIMMAVSVLGRTESAVAGSAWGVMMPFAMLGGGMIPLVAMPGWLRTASHASPFKWAILSMEGAMWRGFSVGDMLLPCGILLGTGALFFGLGVAMFRRADG